MPPILSLGCPSSMIQVTSCGAIEATHLERLPGVGQAVPDKATLLVHVAKWTQHSQIYPFRRVLERGEIVTP